jgi:hypothetical protein
METDITKTKTTIGAIEVALLMVIPMKLARPIVADAATIPVKIKIDVSRRLRRKANDRKQTRANVVGSKRPRSSEEALANAAIIGTPPVYSNCKSGKRR